MISAGDFRNGAKFEDGNEVFEVLEFLHVKPGKGAAFVRAKLRNIMTGSIVEKTFNPSDKFQEVNIEFINMDYLYNDGPLYYFMNTQTYEQIPIDKKTLGDALKYVKENMTVKVLFYKEKPFSVEPPNFVELKVTKTEPGYKGDTATGATKPAILETGAEVKVPLFISEGDIIRVDTRSGEYMERI